MSIPKFLPTNVLRNSDMENKLNGLRTNLVAFEVENIFFLIVKDVVTFRIDEV